MKTTLGFLTEEGRTRRKNAVRRILGFAVVVFALAGAGGYGLHRYWVSPSLTTLQRVYLWQYLKSSCLSYLPNSRSHYTRLARTVIDPRSRKEVLLAVLDDDIVPVLDEAGHIRLDKDHRPRLLLKTGIAYKHYYWDDVIAGDKYMYDWLQGTIYDGKSIPDIWRPAWLGAILILILGIIASIALDQVSQRRFLKGQPIRGTRELLPKAYAREHRKHRGYEVTVYASGGPS